MEAGKGGVVGEKVAEDVTGVGEGAAEGGGGGQRRRGGGGGEEPSEGDFGGELKPAAEVGGETAVAHGGAVGD